jgi:hypothetical protein
MIRAIDVRASVILVAFPVFVLSTHAGPAHANTSLPHADVIQDTATVRDSAGVRIVENHRPAWPRGREWLVASQPSVTIGDIEGEEHDVLSVVTGAVRLSDGSIAVGDGGALRVRIYDRGGRHLRSFGGPGEGPGEFGVMGMIGRLRGDSVGVWDRRRKRMTVFSKTGEPRTGPPATVSGELVPAIGWLEDGSLIVTPMITFAEAMRAESGETRREKRFIVIRPDGTEETVLVLRGQETIVTRSGRTYAPKRVLFGRDSYLAPSAAGFVAGESDSFELRRRSWDGRLVTIIRKPGPARTVTDAELMIAEANAERVRQQILRITGRAGRGSSSTADTKPPHRATHPYFDALMVDATEHIWVRQSSLGAATQSWLVFDPGGIWLGAISLPGNLRVTDIGSDYILGIYRDDLGVESVRLYGLDRR